MLNDKDCTHTNGNYDSKDGRLRCVDCLIAVGKTEFRICTGPCGKYRYFRTEFESVCADCRVPMTSMKLPCPHCTSLKTFTWDPIFKRYECPIVGCPSTYKLPEAEMLIAQQKAAVKSTKDVPTFRYDDYGG